MKTKWELRDKERINFLIRPFCRNLNGILSAYLRIPVL